jgi:hypothetical protein
LVLDVDVAVDVVGIVVVAVVVVVVKAVVQAARKFHFAVGAAGGGGGDTQLRERRLGFAGIHPAMGASGKCDYMGEWF